MVLGTGAVIQPASRARRRGGAWGPAVVAVGGGLLAGLAWRLVAPMATTTVSDGAVYLRGHQELQAAQDCWLAVLLAVGGVLLATWQVVRRRPPSVAGLLATVVALVVAAVIAWRVGQWLGPAPLADQLKAGVARPVTPLRLHSLAVLLVAPLMYSLTTLVASFSSTLTSGDR